MQSAQYQHNENKHLQTKRDVNKETEMERNGLLIPENPQA
jgi:hypothetical protein